MDVHVNTRGPVSRQLHHADTAISSATYGHACQAKGAGWRSACARRLQDASGGIDRRALPDGVGAASRRAVVVDPLNPRSNDLLLRYGYTSTHPLRRSIAHGARDQCAAGAVE